MRTAGVKKAKQRVTLAAHRQGSRRRSNTRKSAINSRISFETSCGKETAAFFLADEAHENETRELKRALIGRERELLGHVGVVPSITLLMRLSSNGKHELYDPINVPFLWQVLALKSHAL
jgi:hypothetical protein